MCWEKIKRWKMWNWRVFQWLKSACLWIKGLFTHRITKKIFSGIADFILFIGFALIVFGLGFAIMSGIYYGNKPDFSHQHSDLVLDIDDYFIITYDLVADYTWDIELIIDTPNANFRVYILPTDSINFVGDVPETTGIQGYYPINHQSYWHIMYDIPTTDTWTCLIVNYEVTTAQFDLEMDIITTARWIDFTHNAVKTISDYWLIPIFTVVSLVFFVRELSKKRSENNNSINNQTPDNSS